MNAQLKLKNVPPCSDNGNVDAQLDLARPLREGNTSAENKCAAHVLEQEGCLPARTLEEIRQEMMEKFPGTTIAELEAMGL